MPILQWIFAGLLQCFIASLILVQCSGKKQKKPEPAKPDPKADPKAAAKPDPKKPDAAKPPATALPVAPKPDEKPKPEAAKDKPAEPPKEAAKSPVANEEKKSQSKRDASMQLQATQAHSVKSSARGDTKPDASASNSKSINTAGDPKEVKITPSKLNFKDGDEKAKLQIQNMTDKPLALKLKCSDNEVYKFKPVFFYLKPKEEHEHEVTRKVGSKNKPDKLLVVYTEAKDSEDAKKIYEARPPAKELPVSLAAAASS